MGLASIFSSDKTKSADWEKVARDVTATLYAYYKTEPERVFTGPVRVMLQKDLEIQVYNDTRNPKHLWGWQDKTLVFFATHLAEAEAWRTEMESDSDEAAKIFATERFARLITGSLRDNVANGRLAAEI